MLHVCLCDWDKVCPQESVLFFYWLLQGEKGRRPWRISFKTLRLSQESGGKQRWHASILKSCTNFTSFESSLCLHNGWMSSRNVNSLMKKKTRKKEKDFRKSTKEVMADFWTKFRAVKFKFHSGVTDIIACIKNNTWVFDIMSAHYIHHPRVHIRRGLSL